MNWNTLISAKRFGLEEFHQERHENRSEFQRDYDRLVFSAPFRRLQNKTQVFPLPGSIFVHNRLTHSLEVSCVGRSLGNDVAKAILARQPELQNSYLPSVSDWKSFTKSATKTALSSSVTMTVSFFQLLSAACRTKPKFFPFRVVFSYTTA